MALNDVYLCKIIMSVNGQPASLALHFKIFSGVSGDDPCGGLAAGVAASLGNLLVVLAENVEMNAVECRVAQGELKPPALAVLSPEQGEVAGDALPLIKAVVVKFDQNELPGRFNGRAYVPGISEDSTTGNLVSDQATLTQLEEFFSSINLVTFDAGTTVYEFFHCINTSGPVSDVNPRVTDSTAVPIIYTQRRRRTRARGVFQNT